MRPDFSVILPTRGLSPFLAGTVASVLAGPPEMELLLIHDRREGEPDLSRTIVDDPRVRLLHPPTAGVSNARNIALDQARGAYIAFIDDDDLWLAGRLEEGGALLDRHPRAIMAGSDARILEVSGETRLPNDLERLPRLYPGRPSGSVPLHDLLLENWFHPSTVVLRRELLGAADRFDPKLHYMEDYDLWLRLAHRADPLFDDRCRVVIRRHAHNASRNTRGMAEGSLRILERFVDAHRAGEALSRNEWRVREGRLWHDLAYACLVDDDARAARRAAREAVRRMPLIPKNYIYLLATGLPATMRRALVYRGRRAASARRS